MDSEPIQTQPLGSKSKCTLSSETPTRQYPGRGAHATRDLQGSGWCQKRRDLSSAIWLMRSWDQPNGQLGQGAVQSKSFPGQQSDGH